MSEKFPRIPHLPFSPGGTRDDRRIYSLGDLLGREVVITEKLDGSNVCLTNEDIFARSHSGPPTHRSFDFIKNIHAILKYSIEPGYSIFGEYCYAVHSIAYEGLPTYFFVIGIRDDSANTWLSWAGGSALAKTIGLGVVPELYTGTFHSGKQLEEAIMTEMDKPSIFGGPREGIVVRVSDVIPGDSFVSSIAKCVRAEHVQTEEHWSEGPIKVQTLRKNLPGNRPGEGRSWGNPLMK